MREIDTGTGDLLARVDNGVAVLTLNRPERRNAFSTPMIESLGRVLAEVELDDDVGSIVLTGAGGGFCAGGDVKAMAGEDDGSVGGPASAAAGAAGAAGGASAASAAGAAGGASAASAASAPGAGSAGGQPSSIDARIHRQRLSQRATSGRLWQIPKPTIAALPGPAAGAGLSLALACDLRYAVEGTVLTTAFARVGFSGDYGGTWFLTRLVGAAKARELYYFSDRISAEEAQRLGIVNAVFPAATFEREVMDRAARLAAGPRIAYRYMKENLNRAVSGELGDCLDLEATHHIHSGRTEDHREAVRAFVEKREPSFRGR